jgi:hypothetical protein
MNPAMLARRLILVTIATKADAITSSKTQATVKSTGFISLKRAYSSKSAERRAKEASTAPARLNKK